MPLSSTTASTEQSRPGLQAAFSLSGPFFFASEPIHALASRPHETRRIAFAGRARRARPFFARKKQPTLV